MLAAPGPVVARGCCTLRAIAACVNPIVVLAAGVARCDIGRRGWSRPPRPAECPQKVDYGQGLEVAGAGAGRVVCAGDTATGMTCSSSAGGHGFAISVQSYRLF